MGGSGCGGVKSCAWGCVVRGRASGRDVDGLVVSGVAAVEDWMGGGEKDICARW